MEENQLTRPGNKVKDKFSKYAMQFKSLCSSKEQIYCLYDKMLISLELTQIVIHKRTNSKLENKDKAPF